ncbi:MAG: response regulator [Deltaproteobacteria bacterium]|nr:response regulator [Deltaproteobacteria bacterium]
MAFTVLIVDDSSSMRAVIKKTIKVSGFNVGRFLTAEDGRDAMKVLSAEWVDLVLTDINMPNMNGMELIQKMKEDEILKTIPVVIVTTEGSEKVKKQSMDLGANALIKKPFRPEDIRNALNRIMGEKEDGQKDYSRELEGSDF